METVIFLLILGSVVVVVLYLTRHRDPARTPGRAAPVVVEQPVVVAHAAAHLAGELVRPAPPPIIELKVAAPTRAPVPPAVVIVEAPKPKRSRTKIALQQVPSQAPTSSMAMVLSMLKERNSLAAAFVLREIFDAPVSRRRRYTPRG